MESAGRGFGLTAGADSTTASPARSSSRRPSGLDGLKPHLADGPSVGRTGWQDASRCFSFLQKNFCIRENANFGTWDGVFPTCLAHLLNVIVFLRTGFIVAKAGVLLSLTISLVCLAFAAVTVLSAVGILRRSSVECRDVYHILSVTLGTPVAGSVGLIYAFTHAVSCSLHVLGMGELIVGVCYTDTNEHEWVVRGVACGCLLILTALNVFGIKWIIRAQYIIVILIALGVGDFFIGALFRKVPENGIEGPSGELLRENLYPKWSSWHDYFQSLGIFFPSTVGVLVGFNIAADLRDPHQSIPKGTFAALFCSMWVHFLFILLLGMSVLRSFLEDHPHTTVRMAAVQIFIIAAIFVSSFAAGMGAVFNASKILARVAKDTSISGIRKLDWEWAKYQTPLLSLAVVSSISLVFVLIGRINFLAPIITTAHFLTFATINYAYFALSTTYKLQVNRQQTATTQWLQQGLREGRIASPESRSPKTVRSPADRDIYGTMSHSSSMTSERSHLLGSGQGSQVTTPKEPLLSAKVASPVLSKPEDGPLKYHNRWVALGSAILMAILAFVIQWESALSTASSLGLIYILINFLTPQPSPGIVEFHPLDWMKSKFSGEPEELQPETMYTDMPTVMVPEESRFIASTTSPTASDSVPFIPRQR